MPNLDHVKKIAREEERKLIGGGAGLDAYIQSQGSKLGSALFAHHLASLINLRLLEEKEDVVN